MTEKMIEIKQADRNNFCETSMDFFDRFQEVQNVWRMENGRLVLKFQPFTETWSPSNAQKVISLPDRISPAFLRRCSGDQVSVKG